MTLGLHSPKAADHFISFGNLCQQRKTGNGAPEPSPHSRRQNGPQLYIHLAHGRERLKRMAGSGATLSACLTTTDARRGAAFKVIAIIIRRFCILWLSASTELGCSR